MKITLIILILALIAKDTSQLNDPYLMRGIAQFLCLGVSAVWFLNNLSLTLLKRYWPIIGYVSVLFISIGESATPRYVFLQVISLVAVLFFFVTYFERFRAVPQESMKVLTTTTVILYSTVAALSLIFLFIYPDIAYGTMKNGNAGLEYRFRGLFPKSGMLASAAGLTMGLVWFSNYRVVFKIPVIAISAVCLALTLSRTYWVALVLAGLITQWTYYRRSRKWIGITILAVFSIWVILNAMGVQIDIVHMKFLRLQTLSTLTGRVSLWQEGLKAFFHSPFFGYGFTTGAEGLESISRKNGLSDLGIDSSRDIGRATLHNGYLQSLLDSGAIGTLFYVGIILLAIWRLAKCSDLRHLRAPFFVITFMAVCNFSQSAIYSASVYDSVLFFGITVFAIGRPVRPVELPKSKIRIEENVSISCSHLRYKVVHLK